MYPVSNGNALLQHTIAVMHIVKLTASVAASNVSPVERG